MRFSAYSHGKSSWGGRLKIHNVQCPSLALQACCKRLPRHRFAFSTVAQGATHFLAPGKRDWPLSTQRPGGSGNHCPNQLVQHPFSPVADGRLVKKGPGKPKFKPVGPDQPRSPDTCDSSSARHPENRCHPNDGVGEPPPHETACYLRLHRPPAGDHSTKPVNHRATSAFWSSPPGEFGFVSTPPPRPFLT